jgi:type III secretory pathway component EscV
VRSGLKRQITHCYARGGELAVHRLDPALEEAIRDAVHRNESGAAYLALHPGQARDIVAAVAEACSSTNGSAPTVVLVASDVRRHLRRMIAPELPEVVVLGVSDLSPEVTVKPLEPARI